jgi:hypothetical protein
MDKVTEQHRRACDVLLGGDPQRLRCRKFYGNI